jgi:hypothetical protein
MRIACFILALSLCALAQSRPTSAQTKTPAPAAECPDFPAKLDTCSPHTCTFTHFFTSGKMERKIVGLRADTCSTVEQMPGTGRMECAFPPAMRKEAAQFYRLMAAADVNGSTVDTKTTTGPGGTKSTTTIDGKEVKNPLQQALETGVCKILP